MVSTTETCPDCVNDLKYRIEQAEGAANAWHERYLETIGELIELRKENEELREKLREFESGLARTPQRQQGNLGYPVEDPFKGNRPIMF